MDGKISHAGDQAQGQRPARRISGLHERRGIAHETYQGPPQDKQTYYTQSEPKVQDDIMGMRCSRFVIVTLFDVVLVLRQELVEPDAEDWAWYGILPFVAYGAILGGAVGLPFDAHHAMFAIGGGVLLLTFIGIHNAWDIVTYLIAFDGGSSEEN